MEWGDIFNHSDRTCFMIVSAFSTVLWACSEILGSSSCRSNGVIEFIFYNVLVKLQYRRVNSRDRGNRDNMPQVVNSDSGNESSEMSERSGTSTN